MTDILNQLRAWHAAGHIKCRVLPDGSYQLRILTNADLASLASADKPAKPSITTRASRLPHDWQLPREWRNWAGQQGATQPEIELQAAKFSDYWHAKAGRDAAKMDWFATWRNWIRGATALAGTPKLTLVRSREDPQANIPVDESYDAWLRAMRVTMGDPNWTPESGKSAPSIAPGGLSAAISALTSAIGASPRVSDSGK
jgi:hypothetical protein